MIEYKGSMKKKPITQSIYNSLSYDLNMPKIKEINKQVDDLLNKKNREC